MLPGRNSRILEILLVIVLLWRVGSLAAEPTVSGAYVILALLSTWALLKPEWGFYLFLSIGFSFIPYDFRIDMPLFNSAREVLIFACLSGAFLKLVKSRRSLPFLPIFVPLVIMLLVSTVLIFAGQGAMGMELWWVKLPQFQIAIKDLYFLVLTMLGALLTWLLVDTPDKARNVLISILAGVVLRTFFTTGWLVTQPDFFSNEVGLVRELEHMSIYNTPLHTRLLFGSFLSLIINAAHFFPLFLALGLTLRGRPVLRLICLVTAVAFMLINAPSGMRASIVALTVGPLILLLLSPYWMPSWRAGISIGLLSVFGLVVVSHVGGGPATLASLFEEATTGTGERLDLYRIQINLFLGNPIFGTGFRAGHSTVLDWASAMGLIFLVPALIATLWPIRQLWRLLRSSRSIEERALLAGLLAGWVGIMVLASITEVLFRPEPGMRFWALAVVIGLWTKWHLEKPGVSIVRISREKKPPNVKGLCHVEQIT
ncbi:MAG: O-antigen ligase family protein [Candidatus Binatia bacterium]